MPRTIGTIENLGVESVIIIEVDWSGAIKSYADRDYDNALGKILSLSDIETVVKAQSEGVAASLSVTLDDSDGEILSILNTSDIHKKPASVYQQIVGGNKFLLFSGRINTPIAWNEADRTFSFEIVINVEAEEIGFAPEKDDGFSFIAESALGKAWPLCFGSPIRVPAVKISEQVRGTSLTRYGLISHGNLQSLCQAAESHADAVIEKDRNNSDPNVTDEEYADLIRNYTSTRATLETTLTTLIFDSPTQEGSLKQYVEACVNRRKAERNKLHWAAQFSSLTTQIETTENSITLLTDQIAQQQAANDQAVNDGNEDTAPDLAAVETLKESLVDTQNDLDTLNTDLAVATQQLILENANYDAYDSELTSLESGLTTFLLDEIVVDNGEEFPQNQTVTVLINNLKLVGTFNDKVFTVEGVAPTFTGIGLTDGETLGEVISSDEAADLRQLFCFLPGRGIFFIEDQYQTRLRYSPLLWIADGEVTIPNVLVNGQPVERKKYKVSRPYSISEASPIIFQHWISNIRNAGPDYTTGLENMYQYDWALEVGDEVVLLDDYTDVYIANLIPSIEVKEVIGRRLVDGVEKLLPIPQHMYTLNLNESIAGQQATTIRFKRPLYSYVGQDWTGDVYVTLESSEGPNTADIIKYLVETYTNLSVDATSFATVAGQINKYPSHFALLDTVDCLQTIDDIAWQARCAIYIKEEKVYIKYLAAEEASIMTLDESNVKVFSLGLTSTDQLVTKLKALYRSDYSLTEEDPFQVVIRNNVDKYGLTELERDFYIYNIKDLVVKSATFWMIRMSQTWKVFHFTGFLPSLKLEVFDTINVNIEGITGKGVIEVASYDSASKKITYEVTLAVRAGETSKYDLYWPGSNSGEWP